ncbi:MAG: diadenylate cyclase [Spirochaetes bacterium]|nr:diadenylate cyclase [Spirochaetota bacterium]
MNTFTHYLNNFIGFLDWRIFFDIPIIAFIILLLYRTLKSSGSWRIGLGILIILILYPLAHVLKFSGISWIFDNLSQIALIGLIIIFQPEIRKILERAVSTLRIRKIVNDSGNISWIISDAVFRLAEVRWGAIIILPGKEPLESRVTGGVELKAKLSIPLILSIFDRHSPGHDGAIIIENGEITKFGVRLPLSISGRFGNEFGTRHFASLGLSEVNDSLVIAVSEERGSVSIFHHGNCDIISSRNILQYRIDDHWKDNSRISPLNGLSQKKGFFIRQAGISLFLAFVLWLSIISSTSQQKQLTVTVPIEYKINEKMIIVGDSPSIARITVSGSVSQMNSLKPEEFIATIDLKHVLPGEINVSLTKGVINLPAGISLVDVNPANYILTIHSFKQQRFFIKPQFIGSLPENFEIESVVTTPDELSVWITSDQPSSEDIYLTTTPIYLQTISQDTKLICNIIAPPGIIPINNKQWPEVYVSINVRKVDE